MLWAYCLGVVYGVGGSWFQDINGTYLNCLLFIIPSCYSVYMRSLNDQFGVEYGVDRMVYCYSYGRIGIFDNLLS